MQIDEFIQLQCSISQFVNDEGSAFVTQSEYNNNSIGEVGNPKVVAMLGDALLRTAAIKHAIELPNNKGFNTAPLAIQQSAERVTCNAHLSKVFDTLLVSRLGKSFRGDSFHSVETSIKINKFNVNEKSKGLFIEVLLGSLPQAHFDSLCKLIFSTETQLTDLARSVELLYINEGYYSLAKVDDDDFEMNYSIYDEEAPTSEELGVSYEDWRNAYKTYGKSAYDHFVRHTSEAILDSYKERFKCEKPKALAQGPSF